jgi:hypothetical protein
MEIPMIYLVGVWHVYFGDRRRLRCTEEGSRECLEAQGASKESCADCGSCVGLDGDRNEEGYVHYYEIIFT